MTRTAWRGGAAGGGASGIGRSRLAGAALAVAITLAALPGAPARAQVESREGIALQNQILQLQQQIDQLNGEVGRGGRVVAPPEQSAPSSGAGSDLMPQLLDRVSRLEDEVRSLRGRVEDLENTTQRQGADLGKQISDLAFQVQQMQGGQPPAAAPAPAQGPAPGRQSSLSPAPAPLGTVPVTPPLPAPVPAGPAATPRRTPELAMQEGNAALARRDYATAEAAAREVLNARGSRGYDAQFLLAQALAGQRSWRDAAVAYGDTYQRAVAGNHAQDALVGLANSLIALNDKRSACDALDTLRGQFPTPRPDLRDSVAAARSRAGCR